MSPRLHRCLLVLLLIGYHAPAASARPNVLFLFADDQRVDTIAALGDRKTRTPHLDQLARRGFVLRNTYCMGSTMGAVCNPSRHMTLSGKALFHYDPTEPRGTFADVMRQAGYVTWHLSKRNNTARAYHTAFDHSAYLSDFDERESGHHGKTAADRAIQFLKEDWTKEQPFFIYLGFAGPHDPRVAAPRWLDLYDQEQIALPANFIPFHPFDNGELIVRDERLAPWPRTEQVVRRHLHDYYACVSSIDHHVGRVVCALEGINQLQNTIIVYSADHGLAVGSHGLFGKQSLYEHSMKAPLIIAGPNIEPGGTDALAYLHDIFPTVTDLVGGPIPGGLDGKSLAPVIRGQQQGVRDAVFLAYRDVQRAVRQGDWKLIRYPKVDVTQLFNVRDDPEELHDLSKQPEHAMRVSQLTAELRDLQVEFHDPAPLEVAATDPALVDESFFAGRVEQVQQSQGRRTRQAAIPGQPKRVLFLGDSITHAGDYITLIEAVLRRAGSADVPELINLGLPSETCSGLSEPDHPFPRPNVHERLERALKLAQPDLVVACYGMNDGIYYPFDEQRFAAFQAGIRQLAKKVRDANAKLILLTPPPFDPEPMRAKGSLLPAGEEKYAWFSVYENYDDVLAKYTQWLKSQETLADQVIDLRAPLQNYVALRRLTRPAFALSQDGVHLNHEGHRVVATAILRAWGFREMRRPDERRFALVTKRSQLLHAAWLSHVGHQRPGMKPGLPLEEAQAAAAKIDRDIETLAQ